MRVEDIAKVCHEANRALTQIIKDVPVQPLWEFITDDMRQSCMNGVTFKLLHPDATPQSLHEEWCRERLSAGWSFGESKDETRRTHPALRPYEDLPLQQRKKDALFAAIVKALSPDAAVMQEALEAAAAGEQSVDEEDDSESAAFRQS